MMHENTPNYYLLSERREALLKHFFSTKTRAAISTLCIVAAVAVVTFAVYAAVWGKAIAAADAEHIAFADAGVEQADIRFIHTEYDTEDGKAVYDVEFISKGIEYHYHIDAANGRVLSRSCKVDEGWAMDSANQTNAGTDSAQAEAPATENVLVSPADTSAEEAAQASSEPVKVSSSGISVDEAKSIAVTHVGVSLDMVTFVKAKLENDDGRTEYEIEFYCDGMEYECTIDAANGTVLDCESEHCDDDDYHQYGCYRGDDCYHSDDGNYHH